MRGKKRERDERQGWWRDEREEGERRALVCVCAYASNECVHRIQVVVSREREKERKRGRGPPKDPPRTKWSPLILRCYCKVHPSPESSSSPSALTVPFSFCLSYIHLFPSLSFCNTLASSSLSSSFSFYLVSFHRSRYSLMRMQNRRSFSG